MPQTEDDPSARIDQALSETQRLEREEQHADIERQRATDERIAAALAKKDQS